MPRYIIERNVPGVKAAELGPVGKKSNEVLGGMKGVVWVKSYVSEAEGKIYCEYEAPNPEAVLEHAKKAGIPADRISEVAMEINPDMYK